MRVDPAVIQAAAADRANVYPYAAWMPIKEAATQSKIYPRLLILHSQAGPAMTSLEALHKYVNRDDVHIEPTFILDMSGRMAQLVGILTRADCSAQANPFSTAVETQDRGAGTLAQTPWTDEQCEQLAGLAAFEHLHPEIELPLIPATAWNGSGIGPHRQFKQWSVYVGKTCPGDARVTQIPGIIARAIEIVNWSPSKPQPQPETPPVVRPPQEEDDVVITNSEEFFGNPPGKWKGFIVPETGIPRHMRSGEWEARRQPEGEPMNNEQLARLFAGT